MFRKSYSVFLIMILCLLVFDACKKKKAGIDPDSKTEKSTSENKHLHAGNETILLLKDLKENGDYVNSKNYPSLIKASMVKESLGKRTLVIDLRNPRQFSEGHIKNAVNKKTKELPLFFETGIRPFEFDKIILVCDDGQISSYVTCLLRLMGYGNVFSMRWGMSAWNIKFAQKGWLSGLSGKYEEKLENTVNESPKPAGMPDLNTGKLTGSEIGTARFHNLFEEGTDSILITADEVFNNTEKYYIINLDRKDKYENGHIPGAVRYKPENTLGSIEELASIPKDKPVVVYCGTGHNSGFATAYLRLLGYDAYTLKYGNNAFMHNKMLKDRSTLSWPTFSSEDINNFDVVK